jgi:glucose/mannose-6-phosphate isomerase
LKQLIENFPGHLAEALKNIESSSLSSPTQTFNNVLITGLGGSGIGGTIVAELAEPIASVPIFVNKDYQIPAFVNANTLVIACSYSGDTEETLMAVDSAMQQGAHIACITSGGKLKALAEEKGLNYLSMTGGNPPRSMFGYSFTYLLYLLEFYDLAPFGTKSNVSKAIDMLRDSKEGILSAAGNLAQKLKGTIPIVYSVSGGLGVASRWRQQLNENAKMLSWEAEIPEMNHNELVGWEGGDERFFPVFLRNDADFDRNQKRIEIIKSIISEKTPHLEEVWSKGDSAIARCLYLIHFGDWVSYFLSELNQVDIMDIKSIDHLKSELSKVPL